MKPMVAYSVLATCVLAALGALLLVLRCGAADGQQERLDALKAQLDNLSNEVRSLSDRLVQESNTPSIPLPGSGAAATPLEVVAGMDSLLATAANEATAPKTAGEAGQFVGSVEETLARIPGASDPAALRKATLLEWEAEAFRTLLSDESKGRGGEDYAGALNALYAAVPDGAPKFLQDRLAAEAAGAEKTLLSRMRADVLQKAQDAVQEKGDVTDAWMALDALEKRLPDISKGDTKTIAELKARLQAKVAVDAAIAARTELQGMLVPCLLDEEFRPTLPGTCESGKEVDRDTRLLLLSQIAGAASEHLAALYPLKTADLPKDLRANLTWVRNNALRQAEKTSRQRSVEYQKWALENIEMAGMAINAEKNTPKQVLAVLEENFFSVDPSLLDPALAEFYRHTFERAWKRLQDEDEEVDYLGTLSGLSVSTARRGLHDVNR